MGPKVRMVDFFDAKARLLLEKPSKTLEILEKNKINIHLCRNSLEGIKSWYGIYLAVTKVNKLGIYGHFSPIKVANNIKSLTDERTIKIIKFLGINQIDVSAPFNPVEVWSNKVYNAIHSVLFKRSEKPLEEPLTKAQRKEYVSTLYDGFYALARRAKTPAEKWLIADILYGALYMHDKPSALHCAETRKRAVAIAQQMGLPGEKIQNIALAAYVHDIGKLAISDELLNKRGILDNDDIERIRVHVKLGVDILRNCGFPEEVLNIVKYHHYLKNYPKCIEEGNPPIGSKILTIADSFEAMTGGRIYEKTKTIEDAFLELENPKYNYDQDIVKAFKLVLRKDPPLGNYRF